MSDSLEVRIPDLGGAEKVQVVEVLVSAGDRVEVEDGLITLESDKASMDVPSPAAGAIEKIHVAVGDQVEEDQLILTLSVATDDTVAADDRPAPHLAPQDDVDATPDESAPESESRGQPDARLASQDDVDATLGEHEAGKAESAVASAGETIAAAPEDHSGARRAQRNHSSAERDGHPDDSKTSEPNAASADTEILVLGGGPGGYTAAFRAADLGKRVTLIERFPALGGVCLNVGCIPSKALLHVARVMDEARDLERYGVVFGKPKVDLDGVRKFKDSVVGRLTKGLAALAKQRGVEVVTGTAEFVGSHELAVDGAGGRTVMSFDQAIVAAGSRVVELPGIPWDDPRVIDSTGALALEDIPKRILLIGGGIIGLEMANVYGALGSQLTIVEMLDGLIPGCDRDLVKPLERRLKRRYKAKIHLETRVAAIKALKSGLKATFEGGTEPAPQTFDRVLVAVGRRPNGDRIGAEAAGIAVDDRGFIPVDAQMRTNQPHIFAIGDIVGQPMLAHKATHEGKVAAEVAAGLKSGFDARVVPSVAYTDPEIAWVGLTETEAEAKGIAFDKGVFPWSASGRSLGMGRSDGSTKILFDPVSHRVLGGGIVGPNAGDLIAEIALAIEMDCEAADLGLTVHPHPTLSETVALAAEAFEGTITDLHVPREKS